eukprot:scaffold8001_cov125-Isochrysis_galbana.AAC.13
MPGGEKGEVTMEGEMRSRYGGQHCKVAGSSNSSVSSPCGADMRGPSASRTVDHSSAEPFSSAIGAVPQGCVPEVVNVASCPSTRRRAAGQTWVTSKTM